MKIVSRTRLSGSLLAMLLVGSVMSFSGVALAEEIDMSSTTGFSMLTHVDSEELKQLRGREGFKDLVSVQSIQNMEAAVNDASFNAGNIVSGAITIESGALENFSGVGLFNLVSGNGNAVNSGVSISVYMPIQNP